MEKVRWMLRKKKDLKKQKRTAEKHKMRMEAENPEVHFGCIMGN